MIEIKPDINLHSNFNKEINESNAQGATAGIVFCFKLADRMKERGISVRKLAELTGLRSATISELMNGKKTSINLHHILVIMLALKLSNFSDLIDIELPEGLKNIFERESNLWKQLGAVPPEIQSIIEYKKLERES